MKHIDENDIVKHLKSIQLDIRKRGPLPRPFDQKVTCDVMQAVSRVIYDLTFKENTFFSNRKLIESNILTNIVTSNSFDKPAPDAFYTNNEYDKFVGQITNALEFYGIINKTTTNNFVVCNRDILGFIQSSIINSIKFLNIAITKTLESSGLITYFESFFLKIDELNAYDDLKKIFNSFIKMNTNIQKDLEIHRILPKIVNILAFNKNSKGVSRGSVSLNKIVFKDIIYNNVNSRDNKKKAISRKEHAEKNILFKENMEAKMKGFIRDIHGNISAVSGNDKGTQVHHILPKSKFPQYTSTLENLILLTPNEHNQDAHPKGKTRMIDKDYQLKLLKIKWNQINDSNYKIYYDKEKFKEIIRTLNIEFNFN